MAPGLPAVDPSALPKLRRAECSDSRKKHNTDLSSGDRKFQLALGLKPLLSCSSPMSVFLTELYFTAVRPFQPCSLISNPRASPSINLTAINYIKFLGASVPRLPMQLVGYPRFLHI